MNMATLIQRYESEAAGAVSAIELIRHTATTEGRANLTQKESRDVDALFARHATAQANLKAAREIDASERQIDASLGDTIPTAASRVSGKRTASVSVGRNERTYNPDRDAERGLRNSPGGAFLLDVAAAKMGDYAAQARLIRHDQEMRVDKPWMEERASSATVNFGGLVVPQYAVEDAAPAVTAARPMADLMNGRDLPPTGMSVNHSRITTPTAAGIQTAENTTVTSQAIDDTLLTLAVETAAGYLQLSRQAVDRGQLTEDITVADLLTRVAVSMEAQMLTEASVGLVNSFATTAQSYTNATQDTTAVPTFLKQLPQAQNVIETALLTRARPGVVVMHPRRFNWMTAASSASWPVLSGATVPTQSAGVMLTDSYGPSVRAVMSNGMKICVDANVTTTALLAAPTGGTQDHVYVISPTESFLYEPPERTVMIRAEQPQAPQLGILFVAFEYFAYTFSRYSGQSVLVNGTGLGVPSFA